MLNDLLNETKGFKCQITLKVVLKKYKPDGKHEFRPVYFNSTTKAVINHRFKLEKSFQEVLHLVDNWINEGSGWIVESIRSEYITISIYRPSSGGFYVELSEKLSSRKNELINIQNKYQECFLWCRVRHINPVKVHPERITKEDKNLLSILLIQKKLHKKVKSLLVILIMMGLNSLCKKKVFKTFSKFKTNKKQYLH